MNLKELQEELNRTNLAEKIIVPVEQYRELVKDAMRYKFIKRKVHGTDEQVNRVKWRFFTKDTNADLDVCIDQAIKDE